MFGGSIGIIFSGAFFISTKSDQLTSKIVAMMKAVEVVESKVTVEVMEAMTKAGICSYYGCSGSRSNIGI
jgi:hypothetical protein